MSFKLFNSNHKLIYNRVKFSKVEEQYFKGINQKETLDRTYLIRVLADNGSKHPDYSLLAGHIQNELLIEDSPTIQEYTYVFGSQLNEKFHFFFDENVQQLEKAYTEKIEQFNKGRYKFNIFGVASAIRVYLLKTEEKTEDLFQLFLREAITTNFVYGIDAVLQAYDDLCNKLYTFATPTLINGGKIKGQLSSCFLLNVEDSIDDMWKKISEMAHISKRAGGIGFNFSNVMAKDSIIPSTGSPTSGIIPFLKVAESTARAVNQGGRRKGSFAVYLEPWHAEVFEFCELRKNHGKEEFRTRDLFLALYVNDVFRERLQNDGIWSLMCPSVCTGLVDAYGNDFKALYEHYESKGMYVRQVKARDLWKHIATCESETGSPFMVNKDAINLMNPQSYAGTIRNSNLCTEITEYCSKDETAVCNLATVAVNNFYNPLKKEYDLQGLHKACKRVVKGLNVVIDTNYYPSESARKSNFRHRPVGMGVQGLADLFCMMRVEFGSPESKEMNRKVRETMAHAAYEASMELCKEGKQEPFQDFFKSCYAQGEVSYDLWKKQGYETATYDDQPIFDMWDWDTLKHNIKNYGMCNSLLLTDPPTATTSQFLGNNECFEPYTYNLYLRRTLAGEMKVLNPHLVADLEELGLWDETLQKALLLSGGSVQNLPLPQWIKDVYKTAFEIDTNVFIDMARDRAPFTCQSQSMNLFISKPNAKNWTRAIMRGWKKGLKTLQYYLRRETDAKGLTELGTTGSIEQLIEKIENNVNIKTIQCSLDNPDDCLMCGA